MAAGDITIWGTDAAGTRRQFTNSGGVLLAPGPTTANQDSRDQTSPLGAYLDVIVDLTVVGASSSITVTIMGKDPASGKYYPILASAALGAVATTVLHVGPGLAATANVSANAAVPTTWKVHVDAAGTNPCTYTVGFNLMAS